MSPVMGRAGCPGREKDRLKPAGTGEGVSARIHVVNLLGDRVEEDHRSDHRRAGTEEGISVRLHVANSHKDRSKQGCRSDRRHSANSLRGRVDSCVSVKASIVIAGVGVSAVLRGSNDDSKGAKPDIFNTIPQQKLVRATPRRNLWFYSKGFMRKKK